MRILIFSLVALALMGTQPATAQPAPAFRQVIPAVANTPGSAGSYWTTDVVLFNPSSEPVNITLELVPLNQGSNPGNGIAVTLPTPLGPGETALIADCVGAYFPDQVAGGLVIVARANDGQPTPIVVSSRTWTPGTDESGSYGQGIPAIAWPEDGGLTTQERRLTSLEETDELRTNVGLLNLSETVLGVFVIEIMASDGEIVATRSVDLPPRSWRQINGLLGALGQQGSAFTAVVHLVDWQDLSPEGPPGPVDPPDFVTYASKIDRLTNDPTYVESLPETTQWALARHRVIPAAAKVPGALGTDWRTDLTVHYPGTATPTFLQIELLATQGQPVEPPSTVTIHILPNQTLDIDDVMGTHFPEHQVGALMVRGWNGGARFEDLKVTTRTWTANGDGSGTFGQGISGIPRFYGADPVVITGLEESDDFRTNLGIVNPSTNLIEVFNIEIFDASGTSRGTVKKSLNPWTHLQVNRILRQLGLAGSGFSAVVTLAETDNLWIEPSDPWDPIFMAYGSVVDGETNDPTYVAGVALTPPPSGDSGEWFDFQADAPWYRCPEGGWPEEATVVTAFNQAYHWWGAENHRSIVEEVEFPAAGEWNQLGLKIHLECPESGDCDDWDRSASLQLVLNPDEPQESWQYLELTRYITPYKIEMCEYIDLTPLAPLLTGPQTLVSWIDTWVGPGHDSGEGWRITYDFVFYPGTPRTPDHITNVWGRRSIVVGEVDNPVDAQTDPFEIDIPAEVTRVEARLITTGHSFGNTDNCAEFCPLRQDLIVGGELRSVLPWRTDCEYNPHSPQSGTWEYDRNGWCPGAVSTGNLVDITDLVTPGETATLDFDIRTMDGEVYVNTDPVDLLPHEWVSLQVVMYEE